MSDTERLVASIVQFLGEQIRLDSLNSDAKESLEVAIQCLESAYNVSSSDAHLLPSNTLTEIFCEAIKHEPVQPASDDAKREAEYMKNEGNNLMKSENYEEALKCYTKAIQLDPKNAVFYCNRAAAYSKLNNHSFALEDCRRAIEIDPKYSKAYGRMGLAFASLNDHHQAREYYKKALELDPTNESYQNNLMVAEEKAAQAPQFPGMGGFDIGSILNNPQIVNMAAQVMQDPNIQNLIGGLIQSGSSTFPGASAGSTSVSSTDTAIPQAASQQNVGVGSGGGGAGAGAGAGAVPGSGPGFEAFLRAGQQFAQQMQATNPELVEQLRRQMSSINRPSDNNENNNDRSN